MVVRIGTAGRDVADFVSRPGGGFVPRVAAEDVDFAIAIKVCGAAGFVGGLIIDGVLFPADGRSFIGRSGGGQQSNSGGDQQEPCEISAECQSEDS
ncbi:MAG: hypothetical protein ACK5A3_22485 [Planctomyces sp.]